MYQVISELGQATSFHAIPSIVRSKRLAIKLIWSAVLLISTSICIKAVTDSVLSYLEYNVITEMQIIKEQRTIFPTVTICNLNKGYQLEQALMDCWFSNEHCSRDEFKPVIITGFDSCFQFNSNGKRYSIDSGQKTGLQIEYLVAPSSEAFYENGLRIFIHNQSASPQNGDGIDISTGFKTNFAINRKLERKLSHPYNDCILKDSDYNSKSYQFIKGSNFSYRQRDCFDICINEIFIKKCNCSTDQLDNIEVNCFINPNKSINYEMWYCYSELHEEIQAKKIDSCLQYCPLECDSSHYAIETSFTKYPGYYYSEGSLLFKLLESFELSEKDEAERLLDGALSFNVYYDVLEYTLISEKPQTLLVDLVSNIGGLLGIFIGISFLSILEIFEFLFELIYSQFSDEKLKNVVSNF